MNYYPFHLGDYAAHTAHLSPMEDLAYRRMLDLYYMRECPLPNDWREVARLIRMRDNGKEVESVLAEFFTLAEDGWSHQRCDRELASFRRMSEGGKAGAAKRWSKGGDRPPIAPLSPPYNHPITPLSPPYNPPHSNPISNQNQNQNQNQEPSIDAPQSAAKKRGTRLPQDWLLPKAWGEWALSEFSQWSAEDVRTVAAQFRDYWCAKSGKDATKLDWEATWRNWCRNAKPSKQAQAQRETPYAQHMRERVEQAAGSLAHIVAAKAPGQRPKEPWEVAADDQQTIEPSPSRTVAIGMD